MTLADTLDFLVKLGLPLFGAIGGLLHWYLRQMERQMEARHAEITRRIEAMETGQLEIRARMDVDRDRFSDYVAETSRTVATEAFVLEQVGGLKNRIEGIAEHCWKIHAEKEK